MRNNGLKTKLGELKMTQTNFGYIGGVFYEFTCPVCKETAITSSNWQKYFYGGVRVCSWTCKCELKRNLDLQKKLKVKLSKEEKKEIEKNDNFRTF